MFPPEGSTFCQIHKTKKTSEGSVLVCYDCEQDNRDYQQFLNDKTHYLQQKKTNLTDKYRKNLKKMKEFEDKFEILKKKMKEQIEADQKKFDIEFQKEIEQVLDPNKEGQNRSDFEIYKRNSKNFTNQLSGLEKVNESQSKLNQHIKEYEDFLDTFKNPPQLIPVPQVNLGKKLSLTKQNQQINFDDDPKYYRFGLNKDGTLLANFNMLSIVLYEFKDDLYKQFKELDVDSSVSSLKFGQDCKTLYVGEDGQFIVWKLQNQEWKKKSFDCHKNESVCDICFNSNESVIFTIGDNKSVQIWNNQDGNLSKTKEIQLDFLPLQIKSNSNGNYFAVYGFTFVSIYKNNQGQWQEIKKIKEKNIQNLEFLTNNLICYQIKEPNEFKFFQITEISIEENFNILIEVQNIDFSVPFIWTNDYFIVNSTNNKVTFCELDRDNLREKIVADGKLERIAMSTNGTIVSLNSSLKQFLFYKLQ